MFGVHRVLYFQYVRVKKVFFILLYFVIVSRNLMFLLKALNPSQSLRVQKSYCLAYRSKSLYPKRLSFFSSLCYITLPRRFKMYIDIDMKIHVNKDRILVLYSILLLFLRWQVFFCSALLLVDRISLDQGCQRDLCCLFQRIMHED